MINKLTPDKIISRIIGGILYHNPKILDDIDDYLFEVHPSHKSPNCSILYIMRKVALVEQLIIRFSIEDIKSINKEDFDLTCLKVYKPDPFTLQIYVDKQSTLEYINLISTGEYATNWIHKL